MDRDRNRRLAWHARRQFGLFTRAQALEAGFASSTIARRVSSGVWRTWHAGVYSDAGLPDAWEVQVMAALLAVGSGAVVGGLSAARLWRLPDLDRTAAVQILVGRRKVPALEGVEVLGTRELEAGETTRFGAFPITTVTRTLRELTRSIDRDRLLECAAEGWRRRLTDPDAIAEEVGSRPRWPGNADLGWVMRQLDPQYQRCRSLAEVRSHRALKNAGVNGYVINARLALSSGRRVEVDHLWEREKRVIEIDGDAYHGSVTAARRDAARDRDLESDGYRVLHVPATAPDDPTVYVDTVREFLGRD